jgi:hypothetical protein
MAGKARSVALIGVGATAPRTIRTPAHFLSPPILPTFLEKVLRNTVE